MCILIMRRLFHPRDMFNPAETGQTVKDPEAGSKKEGRISFSRQASQPDLGENCRVRCPVFVYSCSLEVLREQMINSRPEKSLRDIFFR